MSRKAIALIGPAAMLLLLAACTGEQGAGGQQQQGGTASGEQEAARGDTAASDASAAASIGNQVDHTQDEAEFELKKQLAGVESLIEDYKEAGHDTAELENKKQELEKKLRSM